MLYILVIVKMKEGRMMVCLLLEMRPGEKE